MSCRGEGVDAAGRDASLIAAVDGLAREWIELTPGIAFRVAERNAEREAYYRLRYEVIQERGWAAADDLPGEQESDAADERATHLLAWDGPTLAAGVRLVFPAEGRPLPTEETFGIVVQPAGRVGNVDRVAIAKPYRGGDGRLFRALLGHTWLEMRRHDITVWAGIQSAVVIRLYRRMGFEVRVLGRSKTLWGQARYPIRFEAGQALVALRGEPDRWREAWRERQRQRDAEAG
jgi:N-acyl-L-homoserine lactone synthetase